MPGDRFLDASHSPDPNDRSPLVARALGQGRDLFYSFLAHDLLRKLSNNPAATGALASAFKRSCDDDVTGYQLVLAARFLLQECPSALSDPQEFVRDLLAHSFEENADRGATFFVKFNPPDLGDSERTMLLAHLLFQQLPREMVEAEEYGSVGVVQRLLAIIALFDGLTRFAAAHGMGQSALAKTCRAAEPKLDFAFDFIAKGKNSGE